MLAFPDSPHSPVASSCSSGIITQLPNTLSKVVLTTNYSHTVFKKVQILLNVNIYWFLSSSLTLV